MQNNPNPMLMECGICSFSFRGFDAKDWSPHCKVHQAKYRRRKALDEMTRLAQEMGEYDMLGDDDE